MQWFSGSVGARFQRIPHARYRPLPVVSRTPSSVMRLSAPRGVKLTSLAIIVADTIGRDRIRSITPARLLDERLDRSRRCICSRAWASREISMPASPAADMASRAASRRVVLLRDRRRWRGIVFSPTLMQTDVRPPCAGIGARLRPRKGRARACSGMVPGFPTPPKGLRPRALVACLRPHDRPPAIARSCRSHPIQHHGRLDLPR